MKKQDLVVDIKFGHLKIYFAGILHLSILAESIVGIESYENGELYYINYHLRTTNIETYYTDKDIWLSILKQLDTFSEV